MPFYLGEQPDEVLKAHAKVVDEQVVPEIMSWISTGAYDGKKIFKYIWRFYQVVEAYKSKQQGWTRERAKKLLQDLTDTFGADDPSRVLQLMFRC